MASAATIFGMETKVEFLRLARAKSFSLATIGFPVMFYLLFGIVNSHGLGGEQVARYLLATYTVFGLVGCSLFGVSVTLAQERTLGWLELKQASPMPAWTYLCAKLLTAMAFALIIFAILLTLGKTMGGVVLTGTQIFHMALAVMGGVVPFASLGLLLAMVIPPASATGVVNLIYLPMSFLSGLWMPLKNLPTGLQKLAPMWPTYHLARVELVAAGSPLKNYEGLPGSDAIVMHWVWLAAFSVVTLALAAIMFRRNAAKG
jgi:ABC-2 type transport system permease protein